MKSHHKQQVIALLFLAIIVVVAYWFSKRDTLLPHEVIAGEHTISVVLALDPSARAQGLSGTKELAPDHGMLFIFPYAGKYPFWMKDMNYPIDIVWMDSHGRVITVAPNLSPESYPQQFAPIAPARYVLEISAGTAMADGITEGTVLEFK